MENPSIKVRHTRGVAVVELQPEDILDEDIIRDVDQSLFELVDRSAPVRMLLNFARVRRLSSDTLGTLIRLGKKINEKNGVLKLCCFGPNLYKMLEITKVDKIFEIYDDQETALNSFDR